VTAYQAETLTACMAICDGAAWLEFALSMVDSVFIHRCHMQGLSTGGAAEAIWASWQATS